MTQIREVMMSFFDFKTFILDKKEPVLLKNVLKWNLLNWHINDWKAVLKKEKLEFRIGVYCPTEEPQWERKTKLLEGDFSYFLNSTKNNEKEWLYFDYKHLSSWFKDVNHLRQEIDWSPVGFPDIKPEECTIWIGSKGAHTPCHMDCYGFNLVYQIYGKKLWLLFPPEENLKPTRIPYEESSVYSKLNFFSPKVNDFKALPNKCRKVELGPGDVLFVPHKWWHYVENLETSISINVWLPLAEDNEERLKESIVQYFVKQVTDISNVEINKTILNPNMDDVILEYGQNSFVETLNKCKKICQENLPPKRLKIELEKREEPETSSSKTNDFIATIPLLSKEQFITFLNQQITRFDNFDGHNEISKALNDDNIELLEALTNPEVVNLITNVLLKNKS